MIQIKNLCNNNDNNRNILLVELPLKRNLQCHFDEAWQGQNSYPWLSDICPDDVVVHIFTVIATHEAGVTCVHFAFYRNNNARKKRGGNVLLSTHTYRHTVSANSAMYQ